MPVYAHATQGSERIELLDVLRGMAVFGILIVNMPYLAGPLLEMLAGSQAAGDPAVVTAESFIKFFFEGKFYVLFSWLFGYGFWLFIKRDNPFDGSVVPIFRRRMLILMGIGGLHVALLWAGDILLFYGFLGFLLVLFRRMRSRKIAVWVIALALLPSILSALLVGTARLALATPEGATAMEHNVNQVQAILAGLIAEARVTYASGSFTEMMNLRLREFAYLLYGFLFFYPMVLAVFLLGMLAARKRILTQPEDHLVLFRWVLGLGLGLGIPVNALYAISFQHLQMQIPDLWMLTGAICHGAGGLLFCAALVSATVLLHRSGRLVRVTPWLAPVGRMALTHYLAHSLIAALIFHAYGLGRFGTLPLWHAVLLACAVFALQIGISRLWLAHFAFGPVEWLWRCLTYGTRQPFRKRIATP